MFYFWVASHPKMSRRIFHDQLEREELTDISIATRRHRSVISFAP